MNEFGEMFEKATGIAEGPFPFQERFATDDEIPSLVDVPTGLGKTAMAILGWLWRRRFAAEGIRAKTPRCLIYCQPMRVLVEQTRNNAVLWLDNLRLLAGEARFKESDGKRVFQSYTPAWTDPEKIAVNILMGGEEADDWDLYPESDAIIIGTQDMLLSRALNRGYAASRARWPMQFGLLHTDCLWIFDEIQLMGSGLATTAQLEAFRRLLPKPESDTAKGGHGCHSVWMSATLAKTWLETVDFAPRVGSLKRLSLNKDDLNDPRIKKLRDAVKPLHKACSMVDETEKLAKEVLDAHKIGTRTIVVANTVRRACELFEALQTAGMTTPKLVLLHSRFRPADRQAQIDKALAEIPPGDTGTIIVSTQVIESGVDISATTLFTELAPWASMVQRFGRSNRRGEYNDSALVKWIDLPDEKQNECARPYPLADLVSAQNQLQALDNVCISRIPVVNMDFEHTHVIRRRDLIDLFDTTPDLAGNDIDIDRYVRDVEDTDVRLFWRKFEGDPNGSDVEKQQTAPSREELCPAPVGEFSKFAKAHGKMVWRWNFLDKKWEGATHHEIAPGQVYLVHSDVGGYTKLLGWDPGGKKLSVHPAERTGNAPPEGNDDDNMSMIGQWQRIDEHTDEVCAKLEHILDAIQPAESGALRIAARWHDLGKAHDVFQDAIDDGQTVERRGKTITRRERPEAFYRSRVVAKAPGKRFENGKFADSGWWRRYDWPNDGRKYFRHELASALALLQRPHQNLRDLPENLLNLAAYLIAAHHGKVRLSIRSLPGERHPHDNGTPQPVKRFARGVWDGDELPETDLGGGVRAQAVKLSLEPMELGLCQAEPFKDQPSWGERMLRLRDTIGPFRLAYLEAILRAADMRASANARCGTEEGKNVANG